MPTRVWSAWVARAPTAATNSSPVRTARSASSSLGAGIVPDGKALTKVAVVLVFDDRRLLHLALPHRQLNSQKGCRSEKTVPITSCEIIQCHSANGPIGASVDGEPSVDTVSLRLDGTVPGYWTIRKTSVDTTPSHNDGVSQNQRRSSNHSIRPSIPVLIRSQTP